jgi:hypothetical protein
MVMNVCFSVIACCSIRISASTQQEAGKKSTLRWQLVAMGLAIAIT